ncbi:glycosyltransferase family 4 protein [Patescibacteria group bacterium]|nr:glycosyltransferase family 4 protein [Patescibacteria group bacterium]MBU1922337.1 glycosyltransferase family 4 protein [Patescibacteria group bacterium]
MKLLIISNLYAPHSRGGAERVAELQARGFEHAGHEVAVLTGGPNFGLRTNIQDGIKVYRFFPWNIFWYKNIGKYPFWVRAVWHLIDALNLQSLWILHRVLEQEKPDIIISHNLKGLGLQIFAALANRKDKWVHVLHDIQLSVPSGLMIWGEEDKWKNSVTRKWHESFCRGLVGSPRMIISPSRWLLDFYTNKGFFKESKTMVLPNPVDLPEEIQPEPGRRLRMLYAGQIEEHKGVLWLAEKIKKLTQNWELRIAGAGSKLDALKQIVQGDERIKVLGARPHSEMGAVFADSDILIVPSKCYENSPTVVYEGLAHGVPVLVARIGGAAELIEENKNGWTFEPGSDRELLDRLEQIIATPEILQNMRLACRDSMANYGLENYISQLLKVVQ